MTIQIFSVIIAVLIAFYFLRKDKKKDDKYFGKQQKPTKSEQKILDHYKAIYKKVPNDDRLPILERDGFELEDIALTATEIVFDSPIPNADAISQIKKGQLVKLLFVNEDGDVERMWVEIASKEQDNFKGILRNDAYGNEKLRDGKNFYFHENHIYEIDKLKK